MAGPKLGGNGQDGLSAAQIEKMVGAKFDPPLDKLEGPIPPGITRALLEGQLQALKQDQANALAVFNQCSGAIALCEALLKRVEADDGEEAKP